MNKVILTGRLTGDVETRYTQGAKEMCIARYRLAVDRAYKKDGEQTADFINCVAFDKRGEFAEKYLKKGSKIAIVGHIQTGSYKDKDGKTVYTTDIIVDEHEFLEAKQSNEQPKPEPTPANTDFMSLDNFDQDILPFN